MSGDLDPDRVAATLRTQRYGRSLEVRAETGSTNDDARRAAQGGCADGHVVVADAQRAGRGSRGRSWSSPAGTDLYLSVVARLPLSLPQLPPLTLAVGLAVAEAVDAHCGATQAQVKWPNDVWLARRKCAGILVEGASTGPRSAPLVIGVGLNVNRQRWPAGLDTEPTSLAKHSGRSHDRVEVLATVLGALERRVDQFVAQGPGPLLAALEPRLALLGAQVRCDGVEGELLGVSPGGALRVRTPGGVRELVSGTLRPA